jgi:hypothetical protein
MLVRVNRPGCFAWGKDMSKHHWNKPFANAGGPLFVPIACILAVGTSVWAIDGENFELWFPAAVFLSGLLIVIGEFLHKWVQQKRG